MENHSQFVAGLNPFKTGWLSFFKRASILRSISFRSSYGIDLSVAILAILGSKGLSTFCPLKRSPRGAEILRTILEMSDTERISVIGSTSLATLGPPCHHAIAKTCGGSGAEIAWIVTTCSVSSNFLPVLG